MKELKHILELFKQQLKEIEYQLAVMEKQLKIIEKVISNEPSLPTWRETGYETNRKYSR